MTSAMIWDELQRLKLMVEGVERLLEYHGDSYPGLRIAVSALERAVADTWPPKPLMIGIDVSAGSDWTAPHPGYRKSRAGLYGPGQAARWRAASVGSLT